MQTSKAEGSFAHTVLVDMRARLDASESPRRIFETTVEAPGAAGLVGAKRVLDSTPLYDAVATWTPSPSSAPPSGAGEGGRSWKPSRDR